MKVVLKNRALQKGLKFKLNPFCNAKFMDNIITVCFHLLFHFYS